MIRLNEIIAVTGGRPLNKAKESDIKGISIDSRTIKPKELFIAIEGDRFNGHDFVLEAKRKGAAALLISEFRNSFKAVKDIPIIKVCDTVKALGEIAKFYRNKFSVCVIAITGTNGKTTTKDMIFSILNKKYKTLKSEGTQNNQIGLPLTLLKLNKDFRFCVVELGTSHPGEIKRLTDIACPQIGIITNIGPGHLEFFNNLENVFKEKFKLVQNLRHPSIAIFNADEPKLNKNCKTLPRSLSFAINRNADFKASEIHQKGRGLSFSVNNKYRIKLNTPGLFNVYNSLAAIACARILGLDYSMIKKALGGFSFPKSRLEIFCQKSVTLIDDSYNSNPLSLEQAILTLSGQGINRRKILVMADMLELGKAQEQIHRSFARLIKKSGIDLLITVGRLTRITAREAQKEGMDKVFICNYNEEAVSLLKKQISTGDIILVKGSRAMHLEEVVKALLH